jgi:hypothetical protein
MSLVLPGASASEAEWDEFVAEHIRLGKESCPLVEMWRMRGGGGVLCGHDMANSGKVSL